MKNKGDKSDKSDGDKKEKTPISLDTILNIIDGV